MLTESRLEQEINAQPQALKDLLTAESALVQKVAAAVRGRFKHVLIAARGSSDNAGRYAQYLFGALNELPVAMATPSLFTLYHRPPQLADMLVIGISQSGRSPDIVAVVAEARRQGRPTLAITNQSNSPLAQTADYVIHLHAGDEIAVAATKTYTASLGALALLSAALAQDDARLAALDAVPAWQQQALAAARPALAQVERYRYLNQCVVLGRGYNYSTAFEIALKIKELTRIIAEPYSLADFWHGPVALIRESFPVLVVAPGGALRNYLQAVIPELKQRGSDLLVISEEADLLALGHAMPLPAGMPEWLSPLVAVIPGQLFGERLAVAKGLNPDQPYRLTKVTETL